jgi:hypothetical protein
VGPQKSPPILVLLPCNVQELLQVVVVHVFYEGPAEFRLRPSFALTHTHTHTQLLSNHFDRLYVLTLMALKESLNIWR